MRGPTGIEGYRAKTRRLGTGRRDERADAALRKPLRAGAEADSQRIPARTEGNDVGGASTNHSAETLLLHNCTIIMPFRAYLKLN